MFMRGMLNVTTLCALYALPGPAKIKIENKTFQSYSINRRLCPEIDPFRDTIFELYTRTNRKEAQILRTNNIAALKKSNIDYSRSTVIFFHGFMDSSHSNNAITFKDAYLHRGDYNIILVNNERLLAGMDYVTAVQNCKPIGQFSAKFIDFLLIQGLRLSSLHLIGMSLGAQIAGLTSKSMKSGKPQRVTGLDPAGLLFNSLPKSERISVGDGKFVDIIHTNAGFIGDDRAVGDLDIWVNGGMKQPGCFKQSANAPLLKYVFCSHSTSFRIYIKSLYEPKRFLITKCRNYPAYISGACSNGNTTYIGEYINQTLRGNFFINTMDTSLTV
ncbi:lipase member H-like [Diabrotica virgifera virgifera]|uniref:Lipase domain-containing protein n=1 Tax=Diabrotica virgifera virgifera TaxID=50390 RepID=A0ABM5IAJ0_DIAVI|nr:lipase member H-like [Diabrotica virgifera virgifera]